MCASPVRSNGSMVDDSYMPAPVPALHNTSLGHNQWLGDAAGDDQPGGVKEMLEQRQMMGEWRTAAYNRAARCTNSTRQRLPEGN